MATTYEDLIPSRIENTIMRRAFVDGVFTSYWITPVDGYVLHDSTRDTIDEVWNEKTEEIEYGEVLHQGFTVDTASCMEDYDFTSVKTFYFDTNGNSVPVIAYGAKREFYAVPKSDVPANYIF